MKRLKRTIAQKNKTFYFNRTLELAKYYKGIGFSKIWKTLVSNDLEKQQEAESLLHTKLLHLKNKTSTTSSIKLHYIVKK